MKNRTLITLPTVVLAVVCVIVIAFAFSCASHNRNRGLVATSAPATSAIADSALAPTLEAKAAYTITNAEYIHLGNSLVVRVDDVDWIALTNIFPVERSTIYFQK